MDTPVGGTGNDIFDGRDLTGNVNPVVTYDQFDSVTGGGGRDTILVTAAITDAVFTRTSSVEVVTTAGAATLGALARAAGVDTVNFGTAGDVTAFAGNLAVNGGPGQQTLAVNLNTAGVKTVNLGADAGDRITVTPVTGATAGSTQINFTSGAVGNGTANNVTVVASNGNNLISDDEGVTFIATVLNQFNVRGLAADGTLDPAQDRGNFSAVALGTSGNDAQTTAGAANPLSNIYLNAGAGNDTFRVLQSEAVPAGPGGNPAAVAEVASAAGTRHFAVGGAGNDDLNILSQGTVVAIMGANNDTVTVRDASVAAVPPAAAIANGQVNINFAIGDTATDSNTITFADAANFGNNLVLNTAVAADNDTLTGGLGRDTLVASSAELTAVMAAATPANQSISGFDALTVSDALGGNLTTSNIQAGISTVTLNAGINANNRTVTFDSAVASTLNLAAAAGAQVNVASAGTGTADQVTIANTAAAQTVAPNAGVATDVFGGVLINTTGVETLVVNTNATGTANTQTIGGIAMAPTGTATATVNFVGSNSVNANIVGARVVDASGLTGTAGLTAVTTDTAAPMGSNNSLVGSANRDSITLGAAASNVNLGAGNDTLIIAALNGLAAGTSTLAGGEGTDTIQTSSVLAAQLSIANAFNANQSGFEVLSVNQTVAQQDVIRVDNLGVNKVISSGTAGAPGATAEVVTFTFTGVVTGADQVTFDGVPVLFAEGDTPAQMKTKFLAAVFPNWTDASGAGDSITLTRTITGNVTDLTPADFAFTNGLTIGAPTVTAAAPTTQGVNAVAGTPETQSLTFSAISEYVVDTGVAGPGMPNMAGAVAGGLNQFSLQGRDANNNVVTLDVSSPVSIPAGNAAALATLVKNAADANAVWTAAYTTTVNAGVVTFTAKSVGNRTDITLVDGGNDEDGNNVASPDGVLRNEALGVATDGTLAQAPIKEVFTATFAGMTNGRDSVMFDGITVTLAHNLSATAAATAFVTAYQLSVGRTWDAVDNLNGTVTFTSIAGGDRADIVTANFAVTDQLGNGTPNVTINNIAQGTAAGAGEIVLQNLTTNGTLELTGGGNHTVNIINAGLNTNDVLNLELTNSTVAGINFGTVTAGNVERINVLLKDTGLDGSTAATTETLNLTAAQATSIVVTGNNGLIVTGNGAAVTNFDASGVVGNSANDMAADLRVTFGSQNNTANAVVSITGGAGDDVLGGGAANDTFNLTFGGRDTVSVGATRATNGLDTINGFTAGNSATEADTLNLNFNVANVLLQGVDATGAVGGFGGAFGIFNATAANTVSDLVLQGANNRAYIVIDGNATINTANVKSQITGATAANGEILVADGTSSYVLHAASAASNTVNVYRAFDADGAVNGVVNSTVELIGTVSLTNTFGNIVAGNIS